jgi:hypothetical protein
MNTLRMGSLPLGAHCSFPAEEIIAGHAWKEVEVRLLENARGVIVHVFTCSRCGQRQDLLVYPNGLIMDMKKVTECGASVTGQIHNS